MENINNLIKKMEEKRKKLQLGGGAEAIKKQHKLGKLSSRERLDLLLDKGSFIENDLWLKNRCLDFDFQNQEFPGEGAAIGYGEVNGRKVFTFSQDFTLMGGSLGEAQGTKLWRIWKQAMKVGVPIVGINDSGGARVQEGMGALNGYCSLFFQNSVASGWIPQISLVLGPCAGGAVYSPAITDFIVVVEGVSKMFITGPAVIQAVTGEEITVDKLGGVAVHTQKTGVAHFAAYSEEHAFGIVRDLLSYLPQNSKEKPPVYYEHRPGRQKNSQIKRTYPSKLKP